MKCLIYSDLHLEFNDFSPPMVEADVVLLAGDIDSGLKGLQWAEKKFSPIPVVYVAGNHEYYKHQFPKIDQELLTASQNTCVNFLQNSSVIINEVEFLGCTLWTDYLLAGQQLASMNHAKQRMKDYQMIYNVEQQRLLKPEDLLQAHIDSITWLQNIVAQPPKLKRVVLTHHAPSAKSIHPEFKDEHLLNACYASHLDELVAQSQASLWIHGHMHQHLDYMIEQTRVVCNPRGYPFQTDKNNFNAGLVIEV